MSDPERIEHFLSHPAVRRVLRTLTRRRRNGTCFLAGMLSSYGRPNLPWHEKLRYGLPHLGIEWMRRQTNASVETVRERVLGSPAWVRGLTNAARGVAEFGLGRPQVFSAPLMVVWNFCQACNLRCRHCYQNAGTPRGPELSLPEKMHALDELAAEDVPMLAFSGGEPLLAPDFWFTLGQAQARGFHISVATNGTLLSEEVVDRLARTGADYVEVSIDSARPEEHDDFRGQPGYWQKTVEGLRNLVRNGQMGTGLACTVTTRNFHELEDIIALARELGVGMFYVFNFIPTGRGKEIAAIDLTPEQREKMLEIMQTHLDTGQLTIMGTAPQLGRRCIQHYQQGRMVTTGHYGASTHGATQVLARYIGGCGAGRCLLAIQPNGDITPCVFLPIAIGNLRQDRLRDLWHENAVLQRLRDRDLLQGHCKSCEWRAYCGGCRARAYGYFDDITAPDPGCLFNADAWQRLPHPGAGAPQDLPTASTPGTACREAPPVSGRAGGEGLPASAQSSPWRSE
jgi:radical SAM protein with 4Fe4S-binding SPASM domain